MINDSASSAGEMQLVTFVLGQENFGIDIMNVQEIIRTPSITAIPQSPIYVEGVANLRGNILPVIDTRIKFGMAEAGRDESSRVIVVDVEGRRVGLSVDSVSEVLRIENQYIEPAPAVVSSGEESSIAGMVKVDNGNKVVMILDAGQLCGIGQSGGSGPAVSGGTADTSENLAQGNQSEEVQLVSFFLDNEEFALDIEYVREIIRYPQIVQVPNVPSYIKGVISLRDRLLPVIDMRIMLDTGSAEVTDSTRVIVLEIDDIQVGLVVDKVNEVARIPRSTIFPPPQTFTGEARDQLKGIARLDGGKRIIMLIDPTNIMTSQEFHDIRAMESTETDTADESKDLFKDIDEEQVVVFKLAGEQYGVAVTQVQEINRLSKITKVPRAPRFVEGVVNLRGEVIPLIDLRKRFEIETNEYTEFTRIIVSDISAKKIGIIVDEVLEVLRIPRNLLEKAPDILEGNQAARFMNGIANLNNRMIMMLDLENILVEKEWQSLENMSEGKEPGKKARPARLKKQGRSIE